ncbi:MAG: sulfite exporter TauE/SafE family protein [Porticoccus sp.]|nr:sulfite exporter TauE/SafE family protein [Porticoccus sp.]
MAESDVISVASMFLIGLLGAGHCAGMCGGIVAALGFSVDQKQSRWRIITSYNLGRITSYGLMGVLVGFLGYFGENALSLGPWLRGAAGILLILMGFYIAGWWRILASLEKAGQLVWRRLQPVANGLFKVRSVGKSFFFGMLWGWLPCGLVYSALAFAGASATPVTGGLAMIAFGLGTLPAMLAGGIFSTQLRSLLQGRLLRIVMALILIVFGFWTLWTGMMHNHSASTGDESHSAHEHMHH